MILVHTSTTKFDPSIKAHRNAVSAFMKRNAWNDASLRFAHDPAYSKSSVAEQVQSKLLNWYLAQESNQMEIKSA
jgi:hypothetical protein